MKADILEVRSIVSLETNRLGRSAGRKFYAVGITSNDRTSSMTLDLWG